MYDSAFGNTERIAQTIANGLAEHGPVRVATAADGAVPEMEGADLIVLGGPTQRHGISPAIRSLLDGAPREALRGKRIAVFDTRFRMPRWKSGSAARVLARRLRRAKASLLLPPESFFVAGPEGPLEEGELEHAATWARLLHTHLAP